MNNFVGRIARLFFVAVLATVIGIHLKPVALAFGLVTALTVLFRPALRFSILGLTVPLAAIAGSGSIVLPMLAVVGSIPARAGFGGFFAGLLGVWTVADFALHYPLAPLVQQVSAYGLIEVLTALHTSPPREFSTAMIFSTWFIGFEIFNYIQAERLAREQISRGLCAGFALSALLFTASIFTGTTFPHEVDWWLNQGRHAATFSDPNAFGISAFLGVVLLFNQAKKSPSGWILITLVALPILSLFSGSRSALLGQLLFWGYQLIRWWLTIQKRGRRPLLIIVACAAGAGALIAILSTLGLSSINRLQFNDLSAFWVSLQSRLIFWHVAAEVFFDYPVIGVGLNRFGEVFVPYANSLQLGTGIWSDNPNSFYLWILAELGAVGAAIFFFELSRLKTRDIQADLSWLVIFAVLLIFGPHLHFIEVNIIAATLLAQSFQVRRANRTLVFLSLIIMPFVGFAIGAKTLSEPIGLYPWENDGKPFRWTAKNGRFDVILKDSTATIAFKVPNPEHVDMRNGLSLRCGAETPVSITPQDGITTTVRLGCAKAGLNTIFFDLKHAWIPAHVIPGSSDYRPLGMILLDSPATHLGR